MTLTSHGHESVRKHLFVEKLGVLGTEAEMSFCIDELHMYEKMASRLNYQNSWHVMKQLISLHPLQRQLWCSFHLRDFQRLLQTKPGSQANGQNGDPFRLATYSFPTDYLQLATLTCQTPNGGKVSPGR